MKNRFLPARLTALIASLCATVHFSIAGVPFTYQGYLDQAGGPAEGVFDLAFSVYAVPTGGAMLEDTLVREDVVVSGGFVSLELDFSPASFTGGERWLEIAVRPGASTNPADYQILSPRQRINAVPYSIHSLSAGTVRYGSGHFTATFEPGPSTLLGPVYFGFAFASPPSVTVTQVYDPEFPTEEALVPLVANVTTTGFELRVANSSPYWLENRPFKFHWIAAGNGNLISTWFRDSDGDLYSDGARFDGTEPPPGFVAANTLQSTGGDCDDGNPDIHPNAVDEPYDGIDANCDGANDYDVDGDGHASAAFGGGDDCDDDDPLTYPGAMELCNGVDNDCDGVPDLQDNCLDRQCTDTQVASFQAAFDACMQQNGNDPYGCLLNSLQLVAGTPCEDAIFDMAFCAMMNNCFDGSQIDWGCAYTRCPALFEDVWGPPVDADSDGYISLVDCDDSNPAVHPGATEVWYDGVDQDCAGGDDFDQDGDGYRSAAYGGTDCNDTNPSIHPDAFDVCGNTVDEDCDGADRPCLDLDEDGFFEPEDCDDTNPDINPEMPDIPYDGVDSNCDGWSDFDQDRDGYDTEEFGGDDCDDGNPATYPGAPEIPYDGVDSDCDRRSDYDADGDGYDSVDYGGEDCDDDNYDVRPGMPETWYDGIDTDCGGGSDFDQDMDGHDSDQYGGDDCDDLDPSAYPGAMEVWYDEIDQDCDGGSDFDQDRDGFDSDLHGGTDCDDLNAAINPAALEIPLDGKDNDCDGEIDEGGTDYDGDTYIAPEDCDDTNANIHPGAIEIWYDGIDQNCDGADDFDQDGDGHLPYAFGGGDCNDTDQTINPGMAEIWYDGIDQDCDGASDYDQDRDGSLASSYGGDDCNDLNASIYPNAPESWYDGIDQNCDGWNDYDADFDGYISLYHGGDDCNDTDHTIHPGAMDVNGDGIDHDCDGLDN